MTEHDTLFLHWGPGGNAYVEQTLLARRYPQVHFWSQPGIERPSRAFEHLLDAASAEVERLAGAGGRPVNLIAHSFGGHLAAALLARMPDKIGHCHLFSTAYDIASGFRSLLQIMASSPQTEEDLKRQIDRLLLSAAPVVSDWRQLRQQIELIFSDPGVLRHYWSRPAQYSAYVALAASAPPLHVQTFENVLRDFLAKHFGRGHPFTGTQRITIELGGKDPLFDLADARRSWAWHFPTAQIIERPGSGHFIHLEPYLATDALAGTSED